MHQGGDENKRRLAEEPTLAEPSGHAAPRADGDASPLPSGAIGPLRLIEEIGRGGMGVVYRAEQDAPKRTVALKVMRAGLHMTYGTKTGHRPSKPGAVYVRAIKATRRGGVRARGGGTGVLPGCRVEGPEGITVGLKLLQHTAHGRGAEGSHRGVGRSLIVPIIGHITFHIITIHEKYVLMAR